MLIGMCVYVYKRECGFVYVSECICVCMCVCARACENCWSHREPYYLNPEP
jgi:hypothetical protein